MKALAFTSKFLVYSLSPFSSSLSPLSSPLLSLSSLLSPLLSSLSYNRPDLAIVHFKVYDDDLSGTDFIAQCVIPFHSLEEGMSHAPLSVCLRDAIGGEGEGTGENI